MIQPVPVASFSSNNIDFVGELGTTRHMSRSDMLLDHTTVLPNELKFAVSEGASERRQKDDMTIWIGRKREAES
jgi:hypothetical protein